MVESRKLLKTELPEILGSRLQMLLAIIAGGLMPLAFAPYKIWPLAILLPTVLLWMVQSEQRIKRIFLLSWLFGVAYLGVGFGWIYNSLHIYGKAPPLVAGGITASVVMFLALFIAAAVSVCRFYQISSKISPLWLLPVVWFAMEWIKGIVLTGFPWLSLGYAHTQSPLAGFAPLIGVYGVGAVSILMSLLLLRIIQQRRPIWLAGLVLLPLSGYALSQITWTEPMGKSLKVALIQGNIPQEMKWKYDKRQEILQKYWRATQQNWDNDLIVWPETAIPGRSSLIEETVLLPMAMAATERQSNLLVGVVYNEAKSEKFYNSMLLLGENQGVYHKRHLVPFGEYYPYRFILEYLRRWIRIPYSDLNEGAQQQSLLSVKGLKLGVSICYEDVFSRDILQDLPEANILVNSSNDAWFGDSLAPPQHLQISQMRALETARPLIRSTNTGISAFIDFQGNISSQTELFKEQTLNHTVTGRTGSTPFMFFAKIQPVLAIVILLLALGGLLRFRNFKQSNTKEVKS